MVAGPAESGLDLGLVLVMFGHAESVEARQALVTDKIRPEIPDDAACARYLSKKRWPTGFTCQGCGSCRSCKLAAVASGSANERAAATIIASTTKKLGKA